MFSLFPLRSKAEDASEAGKSEKVDESDWKDDRIELLLEGNPKVCVYLVAICLYDPPMNCLCVQWAALLSAVTEIDAENASSLGIECHPTLVSYEGE